MIGACLAWRWVLQMVSVYYRIEIKVGALQTSCVPLMVGWCGTEVGVGLIIFFAVSSCNRVCMAKAWIY
jgi:hypothetical protein